MREEILKRQDPRLNAKFKEAKVSIFGCGGLGSNIAMTLARAGVGTLYLYDYDCIEASNLNRQNFTYEEIGQSKVQTTVEKIKKTLPFTRVFGEDLRIQKDNLGPLLDKSDLFIEAFDGEEMKRDLFDFFLDRPDKYLITASGLSGLGSLEDIKIKRLENITLIGDFTSKPEEGLYLAYVSVIAGLQALEALKWIERSI